MREEIQTLSPRFLAQLNDALRKIGGHIFNEQREKDNEDRTDTKQVRIGRTCTGSGGSGSGAFSCATYPEPPANTYLVEFGKASFPEDCGEETLTFTPYDPAMLRFVHSPAGQYIPEGSIILCRLIHGQWYTEWSEDTLVELCLAENHPGRGIPFDAYLGVWDSGANCWLYGASGGSGSGSGEECPGNGTVKAIDWRCGVPYPDAGAKGVFVPKPSDAYGTIYYCVDLDCTSPGACCTYATGECP